MPFDVGDFVGAAAREVAETFREGAGQVAEFYGDALEALPDGPPVVAIARGVAQQACRRYADNPDGMPGIVAAGFERVCRPYLDAIGYGQEPELEKPFEGGQCSAKYIVSYTLDSAFPESSTGTLLAFGPIRGLRSEPQSNGSVRVFLQANSQPVFGGQCFNVVFDGGPQDGLLGSYTPTNGSTSRINSVTPCGADDCGNPPPVYRRPVPPPIPGPRVEPFNPRPGINIDIDLEIGPQGDITFNVGTGPIIIAPFAGLGGGGDGPEQPGSGFPPGDVGSPAAPADTGEDGVAAGCAPPNSILVGVKINILEPLPDVSVYDPLVRRGVCYVYMGVPGNLALEPSGVALRDGQFCLAPVDFLTCWEVRANVGYQLRVTPYYRALEPEEV